MRVDVVNVNAIAMTMRCDATTSICYRYSICQEEIRSRYHLTPPDCWPAWSSLTKLKISLVPPGVLVDSISSINSLARPIARPSCAAISMRLRLGSAKVVVEGISRSSKRERMFDGA